jgi:hypothetical protein
MAQETIVRFVDDLDGTEGDVKTVHFGLHNKRYEIDLKPEHVKALEENLADFIAAARQDTGKDKSPNKPGRKAPGEGTVRANRDEVRKIREWAAENGHTISERGRIPKTVMEAYQQAS